MGKLWAVKGDPDTHGGGELLADADSSPQTVFVNNIPIIVKLSNANPDDGAIGQHVDPYTTGASPTVFAYNYPAHRDTDSRACGAQTTVVNQSTVFLDD